MPLTTTTRWTLALLHAETSLARPSWTANDDFGTPWTATAAPGFQAQ